MSRFAAITVWDEARIVSVASCDNCPFRERKKYGGLQGPKCHWSSARGKRIGQHIPAVGFPENCPLPTKRTA